MIHPIFETILKPISPPEIKTFRAQNMRHHAIIDGITYSFWSTEKRYYSDWMGDEKYRIAFDVPSYNLDQPAEDQVSVILNGYAKREIIFPATRESEKIHDPAGSETYGT